SLVDVLAGEIELRLLIAPAVRIGRDERLAGAEDDVLAVIGGAVEAGVALAVPARRPEGEARGDAVRALVYVREPAIGVVGRERVGGVEDHARPVRRAGVERIRLGGVAGAVPDRQLL